MDSSTVLYASETGLITSVSDNSGIFLPPGCVSMIGLPIGALLAGYPQSNQVKELDAVLATLHKRQLRKGSGFQATVETVSGLALSSTFVTVRFKIECPAVLARVHVLSLTPPSPVSLPPIPPTTHRVFSTSPSLLI